MYDENKWNMVVEMLNSQFNVKLNISHWQQIKDKMGIGNNFSYLIFVLYVVPQKANGK